MSAAPRDRVGVTNAPSLAASSASSDTAARAVPDSSQTLKRTVSSAR